MQDRQDLVDGEAKIEIFLTYLATEANVAASTQNQAMNALVFLYKDVYLYFLPCKLMKV